MKNFLMSRHYNFKFVAQIIIKVCVCELNNILKLIYEPGVWHTNATIIFCLPKDRDSVGWGSGLVSQLQEEQPSFVVRVPPLPD